MPNVGPTLTAHRRLPTQDGFCPVLQPGDYCQDKIHGIWHFRTPQDTLFCLEPSKRTGNCVETFQGSITTILVPPSFASSFPGEDGISPNNWTIRDGEWTRS